MKKTLCSIDGTRVAAMTPPAETRSSCASPQWTRERASFVLEEHLPSPLFALTVILALAVVAAFGVLVQMHGASEPMMFLVMPIPLAAALIVTIVVHDREAQRATVGS